MGQNLDHLSHEGEKGVMKGPGSQLLIVNVISIDETSQILCNNIRAQAVKHVEKSKTVEIKI